MLRTGLEHVQTGFQQPIGDHFRPWTANQKTLQFPAECGDNELTWSSKNVSLLTEELSLRVLCISNLPDYYNPFRVETGLGTAQQYIVAI